MKWRKLAFEPFILGMVAGILTGNLSLGLITTGFAILIWGYRSGVNFIILGTVLVVAATGNINFEIIFIYFLTLAYLIEQQKFFSFLEQKFAYIIVGIVSIALFPVWKMVLGFIPARILNEINISGVFLLLTALILNIKRGICLINEDDQESKVFRFLLVFIMAALGINGNPLIIPFWVIGIILIYLSRGNYGPYKLWITLRVNIFSERQGKKIYLLGKGSRRPFYFLDNNFNRIKNINFPFNLIYLILFGLIGLTGYILLPLNIIFIVGVMLFFYTYWRQRKVPLLGMVYLSVLLGMIGGRLGLLS
jgi:hypothetical protein